MTEATIENEDCIENSPFDLIFKHDSEVPLGLVAHQPAGQPHYVTATRALAAMQKEALVHDSTSGATWRMFSDEGPWLNGTDLAPFPLAFFSAGLAASYLSEFLTHAHRSEIEVEGLEIVVDNLYSMEGSLLRGTMVAGAMPVSVRFHARRPQDNSTIVKLAHLAVGSSPADAMLRQVSTSRFTLNHNGRQVPVAGLAVSDQEQHADPLPLYALARPGTGDALDWPITIMERLDYVDTVGGDKLGTQRATGDVGLSDKQKRRVHVRCAGTVREDGLKDLQVACFQPIGSVFRLLSDDSAAVGGRERAPSGLAYLSAGISFCFMTQLGRYAHVAKHPLDYYRIVQKTSFSNSAASNSDELPPNAESVHTDVFVGDQRTDEDACTLLRMGEQTCYLHAACRGELKTRIRTGA